MRGTEQKKTSGESTGVCVSGYSFVPNWCKRHLGHGPNESMSTPMPQHRRNAPKMEHYARFCGAMIPSGVIISSVDLAFSGGKRSAPAIAVGVRMEAQ